MDWTLVFIVAMPLAFVGILFAMYRFGIGRTDWNPPPHSASTEPSDTAKLKIIAGFSLLLYFFALFYAGPLVAAFLLAVVLAFDAICVLVFTSIQEVVFWLKEPKLDTQTGAIVERRPFLRRFLWNFLNSFEALFYLVP